MIALPSWPAASALRGTYQVLRGAQSRTAVPAAKPSAKEPQISPRLTIGSQAREHGGVACGGDSDGTQGKTLVCPAGWTTPAAHAVGQDRRQMGSNGMTRWNDVAELRKVLGGFVIGATVMTSLPRNVTSRGF